MACRFLVQNGVLQDMDVSPAPQFLISVHPGAYTTTRTGGNGSRVLLWERHLLRLCQSLRLLAEAKPQLYPARPFCLSTWNDDQIKPLVQPSLEVGLSKALQTRKNDEEMLITTLVCGSLASVEGGAKKAPDVYVHLESYIPSSIGNVAAHLAIIGSGREVASAKSSEWVRTRQSLEKLRPPSTTELLLSNDGDNILEGTITNFFAVCYQETKEKDEEDINEKSASSKWIGYEVLTAPVIDGVLPGVIRQLVMENIPSSKLHQWESQKTFTNNTFRPTYNLLIRPTYNLLRAFSRICADEGIPLRETAPSWSNRQVWKEAFITNSVRLVQHVESIEAPSSWSELSRAKSWKEVSWKALYLEGPRLVTQKLQKLVQERAMSEGYWFRDVAR